MTTGHCFDGTVLQGQWSVQRVIGLCNVHPSNASPLELTGVSEDKAFDNWSIRYRTFVSILFIGLSPLRKVDRTHFRFKFQWSHADPHEKKCLCDFYPTKLLHMASCRNARYKLGITVHGTLDLGRAVDWNHRGLSSRAAQVLPTHWPHSLPKQN